MHRTKAKSTKRQDRYLGTAQRYTEASKLFWLQGLAQCRKIVYMHETKLAM